LTAYLSGRGVNFEERNVTADPNAVEDLIFKYQSRQTPTTVIGEEVIIGFDRHRLEKLLSD
jgi:glutaredoxin 3